MAIKIKQQEKTWRIEIDCEEWQFDSRADMEKGLKTLLDLKEKKGQIRRMIK